MSTSETPRTSKTPGAIEPPRSVVEAVKGALTLRTGNALVIAEVTLGGVAHWLDGRARSVGELGRRLTTPAGDLEREVRRRRRAPAAIAQDALE